MSAPRFSVVIPTYERPPDLVLCLDAVQASIAHAGLGPDEIEVVVTDDSRNDDSRRLVEQRGAPFRWAAGPRRGPASNRNSGASHVRGEWIIFVDDDCIPAPGWLAAYRAALAAQPAIRVFEGKTIADRPRHRADEVAPIVEGGGYLWSCNMAISAALFRELGGFDTRYRVHNEDKDLAARLRARSQTYPFVADAVVVHPWRRRKVKNDGWKPSSGYLTDTLLYLTLHPPENRRMSWHLFLRMAVRGLLNDIQAARAGGTAAGLSVSVAWAWQLVLHALAIGRHQHFRLHPRAEPLVPAMLTERQP